MTGPTGLEQFIRAACAATPAEKLLWLTVPCPAAPLTALHEHAPPSSTGFVYLAAQRGGLSSVGEVRRFQAAGPGRMAAFAAWSEALFADMAVAAFPGLEACAPSVHGGMAFAPGFTGGEDWAGFGDGVFVLPVWTLSQEGPLPTLSRTVDLALESPDEVVTEVLDLLEALGRSDSEAAAEEDLPIPLDDVEQLPFERWEALIGGILGAIDSGGFEKIVAARRAVVRGREPFVPLEVFGRLQREYPLCNLFLVRHGDRAFVGATPENLFRKRGDDLVTHALAGSWFIGPLDDPTDYGAYQELLDSEKDRREHDLVVQRIVSALDPVSSQLEHPDRPRIVKVRNLLHLDTPVRATLKPGVHAAALIDALHPTPAVGGLPKQAAVDWIAEHEQDARGWYTGTLGWLDAAGNAELAVAIRCGVLREDQASLYAGAGIVADSTAIGEYEETALKQQPMLRALGVDTEEHHVRTINAAMGGGS